MFGKTILPKLYGKIVEKKVSDIFIILDSDAFDDAIQITEKFVNEGISVNFVKLDGKDPNDLGYKKMITKIHNSLPMDFKQIMEMKLYGKKLLKIDDNLYKVYISADVYDELEQDFKIDEAPCKYIKNGDIIGYDIMVDEKKLKKVLKRLEEFDC